MRLSLPFGLSLWSGRKTNPKREMTQCINIAAENDIVQKTILKTVTIRVLDNYTAQP